MKKERFQQRGRMKRETRERKVTQYDKNSLTHFLINALSIIIPFNSKFLDYDLFIIYVYLHTIK